MSAPSSGAPQADFVEQYIDLLVSHKGLPYQEAAKPAIRSHLSSLLREFPSLQLRIEVPAHGDGRSASSLLLQLFGTIPIIFLQVTYNIPIIIWLSEQYPFRAPLVFVVPSPSMIIRSPHPLVGLSGLVSWSHLHTWLYPTSSLVELVRSLSAAFGQDPPVYSRYYGAGDGNTTMPAPSSLPPSRATCMPTSSLLGSGSSLRPPSPLMNSTGVHSASPPYSASLPQSSASLLGPAPSSQRWPLLGYATYPIMGSTSTETSPLSNQHQSHKDGVCMPYQQPSASLPSASSGSHIFLPSAHWHPRSQHEAGASMARSASFTSVAPSLLGPGKFYHGQSLPDLARHNMDQAQVASKASGILKQPSTSQQERCNQAMDLAQEGPSAFLTPNPTSFYGQGKASDPFCLQDATHLLNRPAYLSLSFSGPAFLMQGQSLQGHSHDQTFCMSHTTSVSSALTRGYGILSQCDSSQPLMAASSGLLPLAPVSTALSSAPLIPRLQSQSMVIRECPNTAAPSTCHDEGKSICSTVAKDLPPMALHKTSLSTSAKQCSHSPISYSNPLFDSGQNQLLDRRQFVMDALNKCLQRDLGEIRMAKEKDMFELMDLECLLKHRQSLCEDGVKKLQQRMETLELQLQNALINTELLETWLLANDKNDVEIIVDDIFEPCDGLSHQLLECTASDLALEDAIYCLDQSAHKGILPLDSYLKLVRTLCREQFFLRALAGKVRAAQEQR